MTTDRAKTIEDIISHPFWLCEMDEDDVIHRADSARIANDGVLLVRRNGAFEWFTKGVMIPLEVAAVYTHYRGMTLDDALKAFLSAIESRWKDINDFLASEGFQDGCHGNKPQYPDNSTYMESWNQGQDHAPYRLKFPEARERDTSEVRFLGPNEEVEVGRTYFVGVNRIPAKPQFPHPKGGWTCLCHVDGKQYRYEKEDLAIVVDRKDSE